MAKILFISPHPDDESLSMGMGIANHVLNGHDVYIALLTHGSSSGAIDYINGSVFCGWHNRYHNPTDENYNPLTIEDFANIRVNEFKYSSACLGVKPENILIYNYIDGNLTKDNVKNVIEDFITKNQNAFIKTTSYSDIHPDHSACGQGLLELYNAGVVNDARFYISPAQWDSTPGYFEENSECKAFHQASATVYKRWNPCCELDAVGYHSVPSLFDTVLTNLKSKYHDPNE